MQLTLSMFLIVCPLVFLASFIDAIAGGGGLISLPAYLLAGVPIHNSIATNKLSSCIGTLFSTIRYCKNKYADLASAIPSIVAALIGSAIGAKLSMTVSERFLQYILIIILPITAYIVLKKKNCQETTLSSMKRGHVILLATLISLVIGAYDGFYGPGTGTFLILLYTGVCKMDIKTASGNTKLVNFSSNLAALVTFVVNGQIIVPLGLTASLFSIAGHYIGSGLVMKKGTAIVSPIIICVLVLLFIKIISQFML